MFGIYFLKKNKIKVGVENRLDDWTCGVGGCRNLHNRQDPAVEQYGFAKVKRDRNQ